VIKKMDAQYVRRGFQGAGHFVVFRGGFNLSRRVIVGYADRAGPVLKGIGKHFPGMNNGPVDQAYGNNPYREDFMGAVKGKTDKPFLPTVREVPDKLVYVRGLPNPRSLLPPAPAAQLQHGSDGAGLGQAQTVNPGQFLDGRNILAAVQFI
jgi:hypothetical protein